MKIIKDFIIMLFNRVRDNRKVLIKHSVILCGIALISFLLNLILSLFLPDSFLANMQRTVFIFVCGLAVYFIIVFRGNVEKTFLFLVLSIGMLYIFAIPSLVRVTWDDEQHFYWALEHTVIRNVPIRLVDWRFIGGAPINFHDQSQFFESDAYRSFLAEMNSEEFNQVIQINPRSYENLHARVGHLPAGVMLFVGRNLGLPASVVFDMGRLGILLTYAFVVFFAIKRLESGKHIMAVVALFPTVIFQATNYSADSWVIAFIMLGFAYFFYEVQNPQAKISSKSQIIMLTAFTLGLAPKAIYFLLMGLLFLMPKSKFDGSKEYKRYIVVLSALIFILVGSFTIPFIIGGGVEGDLRGGPDVSPIGQIMFILHNPVRYIGILRRFLSIYLSYGLTPHFTTFFSALGFVPNNFLIWVLLGFVIITDKKSQDIYTSNIKYKILLFLICAATVVGYTTVIYLDFNPVGTTSIDGVQGRYLLPLLFPMFFVLGSTKIKTEFPKIFYTRVVYGIMSFVLLRGIWVACVSRYY